MNDIKASENRLKYVKLFTQIKSTFEDFRIVSAIRQ